MLATSALTTTWTLAVGTMIGALLVAIATSAVRVVRASRRAIKDDANDMETMSRYFFGTPADPRTNKPAELGWCELTNNRLEALSASVSRILREVLPDHNGGHNLRGDVKRAAEAAQRKEEQP